MSESLPLLPLDGMVVLPGMVLPLSLGDAETRAATEAAQMSSGEGVEARVLLVPRLNGKYTNVGTVAVIEQVGRLRGGEHVAVVRGTGRVRIGTGTAGPGAALWVEVTPLEEIVEESATALAGHLTPF